MICLGTPAKNKIKVSIFLVIGLILSLNVWAKASKPDEIVRLPVWIESAPSIGNPKATVTIVEFTDFECPFCGRVQPTLMRVRETYADQVRLVFKHFPLPSHRYARDAHLAAQCAEDQGRFWEYRNVLFSNQRALKKENLVKYAKDLGLSLAPFENCLNQKTQMKRIDDDIKEGLNLGIMGTPAFLINGRPFSGAQPFSSFQNVIEEELLIHKGQPPASKQT